MTKTNTKTIALALGVLLLLATPASAAHTYFGTATATGLEILLGGEGLTIGFSEATVQSAATDDAASCEEGINACAEAAGALGISETAEASAPGNNGPNGAPALTTRDTPLSDAVVLDVGIATAEAQQPPPTDSLAIADGGVATLDLTATQTLSENIPVQETLQPVIDLLDPVADGAPEGTVDRIQDSLQQIVDGLVESPLVSIAVGPSTSDVDDTAGVTTATAAAQGAVITIAPTPINLPTAPEGLIIVEVGAASATATTDQTAASAEFDPAIVRVSIFDPITMTYDPVIEVAPGESGCQTDGSPLEGVIDLCIAAGGGEAVQEGAGAAATAAGVSIDLDIAESDVLDLALARAEAAVNAAPPPAPPSPTPTPTASPSPSVNLPATGGGMGAMVPGLVALGGASLAGLALRSRRFNG